MRSVTTPLFPAQVEGAVTLQAVIDARDGDRLPLDLALYLSGQLGKQVAQLQAIGREGLLDPKRVWCTSKGAVVVHEASAGEPRGLGSLIYRLLSGSGEVSAWPPSYFNPSVAEALDVAVMSAVTGPEDTRAIVDALEVAASGLDEEASVTGMARLVFAVSDDPKPAAVVAEPLSLPSVPIVQGWLTARRAAVAAAAVLVLLCGAVVLAAWGSSKEDVAVVAVQPPVVHAKSTREKTVEAFRAQRLLMTASAKAPPSKKAHGKK